MKVVLAEKPSVARDIAKYLGANTKGNGYLEGDGWVVTWAFGHLVELQEPEEYNPEWKSWRLSSLPMIPENFELRARGEKSAREQLETIKRLFTEADEIVCATDAGREGELIFRYIQWWSGCENKPFKRLWISSLTKSAIAKGMENLQEGTAYDNLYYAAKCRSEADWVVGLNSTRFFTVEYGKRNLLLSIGRVQTPILAMIVGRDLDIDGFVPESFWEVHTQCRDAKFKHSNGKIQKQEEADMILEKITGHELVVTKVEKKHENSNPLLLYDLTDLQRDMNVRYGFTADQTLKLAQSLYEKKFLTYPRTDSRYLSKDIEPSIAPLLEKLRKIMPKAIGGLDLGKLNFTKRIIDDTKVSDHHAIIPSDTIPSSDLPENEKMVYKAVATRLIAAFYPPCINAVTTVEAEANSEPFRARGTVLVDAGWQALYEKPAAKKVAKKKGKAAVGPQILPDFQEGESNPHEPTIEKFKTSAPKRFTEASLLQLMETAGKIVTDEALKEALKDKGVGTPATRASIIEVLIQRKYIERKKKALISTEDGKRLITLIMDERLKSPELTGDWEFRLKQMEKGKYDPKQFMSEVEGYTREILAGTAKNNVNLKNLGPCPCCNAPIRRGRTGYGCSAWDDGCRFVIWDNKTFGVNFTPELTAEFLLHKRTLTPHVIRDGDQQHFGTLVLSEKGEISYDIVKEETPVNPNQETIGSCPVCSGAVVVGSKGYGCANWRSGCKFVIWKQIARKDITREIATEVLQKKVTGDLEGFVSKAGKPFTAKLKVINGEVKLWFQ